MAKKRIIWQIYPPFLAVTLLALAALAVYANQVYQTLFLDQVRNDLERNAILLKERFRPYLELGDNSAVDSLCKKASQEGKVRVTMIDATGLVLGDSERNPQKMDNHADRAEFIKALNGEIGSSERFSDTIQRNMMYVAIPIRLNAGNTSVTHALRTSISTQILYQEQRNFYLKLILPAILISILAASISWYLSRRFTTPLVEMTGGANRFAEGNFDTPLESSDSVEISSLATALNEMAKQLNMRMIATLEQRKELETILTSMSEGIIALDCDSKLVNINKAAKNLLNIHSKDVLNRTLIEVTRTPELIDLTEQTLDKRQRQEKTIDLSTT